MHIEPFEICKLKIIKKLVQQKDLKEKDICAGRDADAGIILHVMYCKSHQYSSTMQAIQLFNCRPYSIVYYEVVSVFSHTFMCVCVCVCVFQCQPTALLRASGSAQGGLMALSVIYFQFTHPLGRPHYVWDEYLYSVLQEVEVRVTVCNCLCSVIVL